MKTPALHQAIPAAARQGPVRQATVCLGNQVHHRLRPVLAAVALELACQSASMADPAWLQEQHRRKPAPRR